MQPSPGSRAEQIEVVPLVVVTQAFPTRPSSLPDIREFVRRRLTPSALSDEDVRTLGERVADVLLDAAGESGTIQVSLRIFPAYAEVDVLFAPGEKPADGRAVGIATAADRPRPPAPVSPLSPPEPAQLSPPSPPSPLSPEEPAQHPAPSPLSPLSPPEPALLSPPSPLSPSEPAHLSPAHPQVGTPAAFAVSADEFAMVSFAVWLAGALRREGMTLEAAARRLGVSVKTVSRWVSGTTEPRLRDLSRIRDVFGDFPFP
jgi:hypothetical protein